MLQEGPDHTRGVSRSIASPILQRSELPDKREFYGQLLSLLLRSIGLTERTSRSSIWNDVFQGVETPGVDTTVQVELADGRSVQGFVQFYSDTADECSIFLSTARWIGEDNEIVPIPGPGILLTKNANIVSVSFLDPVEDDGST